MTDRNLTTTVEISDRIELQLSTSHDKNRKHYVTSLSRAEVDGIFRSVSIMEDVVILERMPAARYSAKQLAKLHDDWQFILQDQDRLTWAAEKKLSN